MEERRGLDLETCRSGHVSCSPGHGTKARVNQQFPPSSCLPDGMQRQRLCAKKDLLWGSMIPMTVVR